MQPQQVHWVSGEVNRETQEIGRYFFENHRNVVEIKMHNTGDVVYVRFNTQQDVIITRRVALNTHQGVNVEKRKRFC